MAEFTLRQLEYLLAVARTGSITAASTELHLSQSAVSTALAELERSLKVQLFLRHARGVSLTRQGKQIVADARRVLVGIDDMRNSARESTNSLAGGLAVGCYTTLSPIVLPRVIPEFVKMNPAVDLTLSEGSHAELEEQLRLGDLDVAILYDYSFSNLRHAHDLRAIRIFSSPPYLLLPENHALCKRPHVRLSDLADEPMILFDLPPAADYFRSLFETEGIVPHVRLRSHNFEVVRSFVARGLGYTLLNQRPAVCATYAGYRCVVRPLTGSFPRLDVDAVTVNAQTTRRVRSFIQQLLRSFEEAAA